VRIWGNPLWGDSKAIGKNETADCSAVAGISGKYQVASEDSFYKHAVVCTPCARVRACVRACVFSWECIVVVYFTTSLGSHNTCHLYCVTDHGSFFFAYRAYICRHTQETWRAQDMIE
jgi:hypothetical protein